MLYEAKQESKAYDYINAILDAEEKEHQAYIKRVEEAIGFEFEKYQGYQPNRTQFRTMDKKKGKINDTRRNKNNSITNSFKAAKYCM